MIYEQTFTRGDEEEFTRHVEAPAHVRGRIPVAVIADMVRWGHANGATRAELAIAELARVGYRSGNVGPSRWVLYSATINGESVAAWQARTGTVMADGGWWAR